MAQEKKQIPLRLSAALWAKISRWADDEFRSVNGQIEYILSEAVKRHRGVEIDDDTKEVTENALNKGD
jgi:hypothetical protein